MSILTIGLKQDFLKNLTIRENTYSSHIKMLDSNFNFHISIKKNITGMCELDYFIQLNDGSYSKDISLTDDMYSYCITGIFNFFLQIKYPHKINLLKIKAIREDILVKIRQSLFWSFGTFKETYYFNEREYFCFIVSKTLMKGGQIK